MATLNKNPFYLNRWEDEKNHLFWLPPLFDKFEENRSFFLIGTRGAGKTTLLKALDWRERLNNKSLQKQLSKNNLDGNYFSNQFIGVYIDLGKQYVLNSFYSQLGNINKSEEIIEYIKGSFFSQYIEYIVIFDLIECMEYFRYNGIFKYKPYQEQEIVKEIFSLSPDLLFVLKNNDVVDYNKKLMLTDLKIAVKLMYESIWNNSFNNFGHVDGSPQQIGKILGDLSECLLSLCNDDNNKWSIKVCIDSIESLTLYQQKALNTLIAAQHVQTSFIFASTHSNINFESTFIINHPLTKDDVELIKLDDYYGDDVIFGKFINEVTRLRFENYLGFFREDIDIKNILGIYTINSILDNELSKTISPGLLQFKQYVINDFSQKWKKMNKSQDIPYVQAYVTDKMKINLNDYVDKEDDFKVLLKSTYEKRRVMAMLCLLYEHEKGRLNSIAPFAGYKMIIRMSERNIRDFLRQMYNIFEICDNDCELFFKNTLSIDIQKQAINAASVKKYDEIANESSYSRDIKNLVNFLGEFTHRLHTNAIEALRMPERGIFVVDYRKIKNLNDRAKLRDIIERAYTSKYYIYMKDTKIDPQNMDVLQHKFHLHRLFAPYFWFSYRRPDSGPQYEINLNPIELLKICNEAEPKYDFIIDDFLKSSIRDEAQTNFEDW